MRGRARGREEDENGTEFDVGRRGEVVAAAVGSRDVVLPSGRGFCSVTVRCMWQVKVI